mgnify:FL=1|jgi:hypothetical protein
MRSYTVIILGKASGEVIPKSVNNRIKTFIRKKYEKGVSIETLKGLVLKAFERDNIKGSLTIIKDGVKIFSIGN